MLDHNFLDYPGDRGGTHNHNGDRALLAVHDHDDVWRQQILFCENTGLQDKYICTIGLIVSATLPDLEEYVDHDRRIDDGRLVPHGKRGSHQD